MRNNQPVTGREVPLEDNSVIVSRTDEKGRIQFINKEFLRISGFTEEELIGQPHNIIRHPDMPAEAFEDMWRDLKAGLPWSGYVKNRVKNGDHYWVHANAMPVTEHGRVSGYVSIRSKPDAETIRNVEKIYERFKSGDAGGLRIEHGRILSDERNARVSRYFEKISTKITSVAAVLCFMILLVGIVGLVVSTHITGSLRSVYADRTVPLVQLSEISQLTNHGMYELTKMATSEHASDTREIEGAIQKIDEIWNAYMATYLTPEEKVLADRFADEKRKLFQNGFRPALRFAASGNMMELKSQIARMDGQFDRAINLTKQLSQLQADVAKAEYESAEKYRTISLIVSALVIAAGAIVAYRASVYLRRALESRLKYLDTRLKSIAGGNYQTDVQIADDELQNILVTVKALQAQLSFAQQEKLEIEEQTGRRQKELANRFESEVGTFVSSISSSVTELQATAGSMTETADETARQSTVVAAASQQATGSVQTVSAATEELSASIREIQQQVSRSTEKVNDAVQQANQANDKVLSLTNAAQKIGSVVDIIREIAEQTNLLALNATIEAARTGAAGKGFAVVASEVKNLAGQTARATEEIAQQVTHIQSETRMSVETIRQIGHIIDDVSKTSAAIAAAVEQQGTATQEIARSVSEAAHGTQEVTSNIEQVREAARSTGTAAEHVLEAASELARNGDALDNKVRDFLSSIRDTRGMSAAA